MKVYVLLSVQDADVTIEGVFSTRLDALETVELSAEACRQQFMGEPWTRQPLDYMWKSQPVSYAHALERWTLDLPLIGQFEIECYEVAAAPINTWTRRRQLEKGSKP